MTVFALPSFLPELKDLRGIDAELVAKVVAVIYIMQGFTLTLAPYQQIILYRRKEQEKVPVLPQNELLIDCMGTAVLATGVVSFCMLFRDMNAVQALGWLGLVWTINTYKWFLNQMHVKTGMGIATLLFIGAGSLITMYAGFLQVEWAASTFKIMIFFFTVTNLYGILFPKAGAEFWGIKAQDPRVQSAARGFFYFFQVQEVHNYCLLRGVASPKAIAYASIPGLMFFVSTLFITKEVKELDLKVSGHAVWLVVNATMIALILVL